MGSDEQMEAGGGELAVGRDVVTCIEFGSCTA